MKTSVFDTPSNPRWDFSTSRSIGIETRGKKMIWIPVKKETVHKFYVVYMTHPTQKNIGAIESRFSKTLNQHSKKSH